MPPHFPSGTQLWVRAEDGIFWPATMCSPSDYDAEMLPFMLTDTNRVPDCCVRFYHDKEAVFPIDSHDVETVKRALWRPEELSDAGLAAEAWQHIALTRQSGVKRFVEMAQKAVATGVGMRPLPPVAASSSSAHAEASSTVAQSTATATTRTAPTSIEAPAQQYYSSLADSTAATLVDPSYSALFDTSNFERINSNVSAGQLMPQPLPNASDGQSHIEGAGNESGGTYKYGAERYEHHYDEARNAAGGGSNGQQRVEDDVLSPLTDSLCTPITSAINRIGGGEDESVRRGVSDSAAGSPPAIPPTRRPEDGDYFAPGEASMAVNTLLEGFSSAAPTVSYHEPSTASNATTMTTMSVQPHDYHDQHQSYPQHHNYDDARYDNTNNALNATGSSRLSALMDMAGGGGGGGAGASAPAPSYHARAGLSAPTPLTTPRAAGGNPSSKATQNATRSAQTQQQRQPQQATTPASDIRLSGEDIKKAKAYLKHVNFSDAVGLAQSLGISMEELCEERKTTHSAIARTTVAGWAYSQDDGAGDDGDHSPLGRLRAKHKKKEQQQQPAPQPAAKRSSGMGCAYNHNPDLYEDDLQPGYSAGRLSNAAGLHNTPALRSTAATAVPPRAIPPAGGAGSSGGLPSASSSMPAKIPIKIVLKSSMQPPAIAAAAAAAISSSLAAARSAGTAAASAASSSSTIAAPSPLPAAASSSSATSPFFSNTALLNSLNNSYNSAATAAAIMRSEEAATIRGQEDRKMLNPQTASQRSVPAAVSQQPTAASTSTAQAAQRPAQQRPATAPPSAPSSAAAAATVSHPPQARRPVFSHLDPWGDDALHHLRYSIFDVSLPHSKDSLDPSWLFHTMLGAVTIEDAAQASTVEFEGIDCELGYSYGGRRAENAHDGPTNMGRGGRRILLVALSSDTFSCAHGWMEPIPIQENVTMRMVVEVGTAKSDPDYDAGFKASNETNGNGRGYVPSNWRLPSSQQNAIKSFIPMDVTEAFHEAVRDQMMAIAGNRGRGNNQLGSSSDQKLSVRLNVFVENQTYARDIQLWGGVLALIAAAPVNNEQICKWVVTRPQLSAPPPTNTSTSNRTTARGQKRAREDENDGSDGEEVDVDTSMGMTVSVQCPISLQLMTVPARGLRCTHQQCCELTFVIEICTQNKVWACPYCKGPMPFREVIVDMALLDYIESTPQRYRSSNDRALFRNNKYEKCPAVAASCSSALSPSGGSGRRLGGGGGGTSSSRLLSQASNTNNGLQSSAQSSSSLASAAAPPAKTSAIVIEELDDDDD